MKLHVYVSTLIATLLFVASTTVVAQEANQQPIQEVSDAIVYSTGAGRDA